MMTGIDPIELYGREFERLATHIAASWDGCGKDHATEVAKSLAGLTHDYASLLARAECIRADRRRAA